MNSTTSVWRLFFRVNVSAVWEYFIGCWPYNDKCVGCMVVLSCECRLKKCTCSLADGRKQVRGKWNVIGLSAGCRVFMPSMSCVHWYKVIVPHSWDTCLTYMGRVSHGRGTRVPRMWDDNFYGSKIQNGKQNNKKKQVLFYRKTSRIPPTAFKQAW